MSNRRRLKNPPPPDRSKERAQESMVSAILALQQKVNPPTPADVARADQLSAAARDRLRHLVSLDPGRYRYHATTPTNEAAGMLFCAIGRRAIKACRHYRAAMERGEPVLISLGQRMAVCLVCLPTLTEVDDGRCDICDQPVPSGTFYEFLTALGNVTVHGDTGICCRYAVRFDSSMPEEGTPC